MRRGTEDGRLPRTGSRPLTGRGEAKIRAQGTLATALLLTLATTPGLQGQDAAATPEEPQEPTPTFAVEVEQVLVDFVVTDKEGQPAPGVIQDDLVVTEDGVQQTIESFEAVQRQDGPPPTEPGPVARPRTGRISKNGDTDVSPGRTFIIVFDDWNLSPQRTRDAKAAVANFLGNGVRPGDSVTLIATSGAAWWTTSMPAGRDQLMDTLKGLDGRKVPDTSRERMSDWEAMRIHVYVDPQVTHQVMQRFDTYGISRMSQAEAGGRLSGTISDPFVTARATQVYFRFRDDTRRTLEAIERSMNSLTGVRGRKSVILVSEGFVYDSTMVEFKRVSAASLRANTAIYFLNARGLQGMPAHFSAEFGPALPPLDMAYNFAMMNRFDDGSENLASESGGFTVKNTNDLQDGIQRIARETQTYYLLGYVSSNGSRDGAFRELEVKFKRGAGKGLRIRARKGYYAPSDDTPALPTAKEGIDPVVQAAVDSPWLQDAIPLRMTHYVGREGMLGKASVLVVAEVDIRGLQFQEVEGREVAEVSFLMAVTHRETGEVLRYDQVVTMRLRPSTRERLSRDWFPIVREFELSPGDHQARIVVRETGTEEVGSVVHAFEVPPLGAFRATTPLFSEPGGEASRPRPLARREFRQGDALVCQLDVLGATRDGEGRPRVTEGHEVRRSDGSVVATQAPSVIEPTSLGALSRLFGLSLVDVAPGEYEMVMTLRDELADTSVEISEPFTVVSPAHSTSPPPPPGGLASQRP